MSEHRSDRERHEESGPTAGDLSLHMAVSVLNYSNHPLTWLGLVSSRRGDLREVFAGAVDAFAARPEIATYLREEIRSIMPSLETGHVDFDVDQWSCNLDAVGPELTLTWQGSEDWAASISMKAPAPVQTVLKLVELTKVVDLGCKPVKLGPGSMAVDVVKPWRLEKFELTSEALG